LSNNGPLIFSAEAFNGLQNVGIHILDDPFVTLGVGMQFVRLIEAGPPGHPFQE
jgi:hypothetical protein